MRQGNEKAGMRFFLKAISRFSLFVQVVDCAGFLLWPQAASRMNRRRPVELVVCYVGYRWWTTGLPSLSPSVRYVRLLLLESEAGGCE